MLRQLKNYLLHDVSPDESEFLTSPRNYFKKLLLDDDSPRHLHRPFSGYTSCYPTPHMSSSNLPQVESFELPVDVVDDGHALGLGNPKVINKTITCYKTHKSKNEISTEKNCFMTKQILHSILLHLPASDLLRCRLVNLRWSVISSAILRNKLNYTKVPPSKLKSFTKIMNASVANPIGSYAIRIDQISEKNTHRFLHLFCPQILQLRVRLNITELVQFARHLQNMRQLKRLHIIIFDDGSRTSNHFSWQNTSFRDINVCDENIAWKMGLYSFSTINKLFIESADPSYQITPFYDRIIANIIAACRNLREMQLNSWNSPLGKIFKKFNVCQNIRFLDVIGRCATNEDLETLLFNTNLRFSSLRLEVNPQVSFELATDIIHRCGDNLLELTVANENIFEKFLISSALRSLVKLRLNMWRGPVDLTYFSRQYPCLRNVSLNLSNLYELEQAHWSELGEGKIIEPCRTVRTLTLTRLETGVDAKLIERLSVVFPNLKELFVEVADGRAIEKIYEVYTELTLLCLEMNCNGDEGDEEITNKCFTGIPDKEIKIIHERECGCPVVEFPEESRSCWNIGCLKSKLPIELLTIIKTRKLTIFIICYRSNNTPYTSSEQS